MQSPPYISSGLMWWLCLKHKKEMVFILYHNMDLKSRLLWRIILCKIKTKESMVASQTPLFSNLFTCTYCKNADYSFTGTTPLGKIRSNSVETLVATSMMLTPMCNVTTHYLGMRFTSAV